MKIFSTLILFVACSLFANAQRTGSIALSGGISNYIGDLGNEKKFPWTSINTGSSITLRDFINNPHRSGTRFPTLDLQVRFSWHRLQYDETSAIDGKKGSELRNYLRGINFRNDLFGTETDITYNLYTNRFGPNHKARLNFFLLAGAGIFYGQPKADLFNGDIDPHNRYFYWKDGTIRNAAENDRGAGEVIKKDGVYETNLRDWSTEGQGTNMEREAVKPYSNWNVGFPVGGGLRYIANDKLSLSAELNYYYFLTDYLDDVSDRYASYVELKSRYSDDTQYELAKYISDPTGYGTGGVIATASPRGNPGQKDSFSYVSLEVSYKITWKHRGIY